MRFMIISDVHGNISAIKKLVKARFNERKNYDALIISGDFVATVPFSLITHYVIINKNISRLGYSKSVYIKELRSRLIFHQIKSLIQMMSILEKLELPIYFIQGNIETYESIKFFKKKYPQINFLDMNHAILNDQVNLYGLGGSLNHLGVVCDHEYYEDEFNRRVKKLQRIIDNVDNNLPRIFVFHEPPLFIRNSSQFQSMLKRFRNRIRGYHYTFRQKAGSKSLYKLVIENNPLFVINGHYHEYSGARAINSVPVINPGALATYQYSIIEVTNQKIYSIFFRIRPSPLSFTNYVYQSRLFHEGNIIKHS